MSSKVQLYVYDVTRGMAAQLSTFLLGHHIEGIWHTAIVCYGREHFFGSGGIDSIHPGTTILGAPTKTIDLGETYLTRDVFQEYLFEIGSDQFRPEKYNLFHHNCNTFSNELSQFLTGWKIPAYILDLPQNVLSTPLGAMLQSFMDGIGNPHANAIYEGSSSSNNAYGSTAAQNSNSSAADSTRSEEKADEGKSQVPCTFNLEITESLKLLRHNLTGVDKEIDSIEQFISGKESLVNDEDRIINYVRDVIDAIQQSKLESLMPPYLNMLSNLCLKIPFQLLNTQTGSLLMKDILNSLSTKKDDVTLSSLMKIGTNLCSDTKTRESLVNAESGSFEEIFKKLKMVCLECFHGSYELETQYAAIEFSYNLSLSKLDEETQIEFAAALVHWLDQNDHASSPGRKCRKVLTSWMSTNEQVKELVEMTIDLEKLQKDV